MQDMSSVGMIFLSLKSLCAAGMAELAQSLCLYLTDTLTGDVEFLADLFKRARHSVVKTEAKLKNHFFAGGKSMKHFC